MAIVITNDFQKWNQALKNIILPQELNFIAKVTTAFDLNSKYMQQYLKVQYIFVQ